MNLNLVLTYHWYDEFAAGNKTIEYREIKPYWTKRIWDKRNELETVTFSRGYTDTTITRRITLIDIGRCPYAGWDGEYYRIFTEYPIMAEIDAEYQAEQDALAAEAEYEAMMQDQAEADYQRGMDEQYEYGWG